MSKQRHSILPHVSQQGPKPPVQFSSSITIADSALLTGPYPITISSESVVHPRARLESHGGRISIGRRCIVHERSILGGNAGLNNTTGVTKVALDGAGVTLGDYVTVEVGAIIEPGNTAISDGTIVGVGVKVGAGAVVGKVCLSGFTFWVDDFLKD